MTELFILFFDNLETLGLIVASGIFLGGCLILVHALWRIISGY